MTQMMLGDEDDRQPVPVQLQVDLRDMQYAAYRMARFAESTVTHDFHFLFSLFHCSVFHFFAPPSKASCRRRRRFAQPHSRVYFTPNFVHCARTNNCIAQSSDTLASV
jgi:hypothetical protein